jgi:hypothetical protein
MFIMSLMHEILCLLFVKNHILYSSEKVIISSSMKQFRWKKLFLDSHWRNMHWWKICFIEYNKCCST